MAQTIIRKFTGGVLTAALLAVALASLGGAALSGTGTAQAQTPTTFTVTITNSTSPEMIVTPGAYLVSDAMGAFWTVGAAASLSLERIAEVGDPGEAMTALGAKMLDAAPAAGDSITFTFSAVPGQYLSTAQMLIASNDGFVGVDSLPLFNGTNPVDVTMDLIAYDAGTEENSALFSGFTGGQPDPAEGAANVDNGTATAEVVAAHAQFTGTQATLSIAAATAPTPPAAGNAGLSADGSSGSLLLTLGLAAALGAAWSTRRLVGVNR